MSSVILIYFSCKKAKSKRTVINLLESTSIQLNVILKKRFEFAKDREEFMAEYTQMHNEENMISFIQHLQLWYFKKIDIEKQEGVFRDIILAEERIHKNAQDTYLCILKNYGGETAVTERLCRPEGTAIDRLKKSVEIVSSWKIEWYKMDIMFSFISLCSHIFDYIKDIGETYFQSWSNVILINISYFQT